MNLPPGIDMSKVKFVEVVPDDELDEYKDDEENGTTDSRDDKSKQASKRLKKLFKADLEIDSLYRGGSIQISSDGKFLVSQCNDKINIIDIESGSIKSKIQLDNKLTSFSINQQNKEILIGCVNLQMRQYKLDLEEIAQSYTDLIDQESIVEKSNQSLIKIWKGHEGPINSIDYHSSGVLAVTGSSDRTVKVWDIEKGYCTHNFTEDLGLVTLVKFHPTELKVISVSDDLKIRVWDLQTKKCIILNNHLSQVSGISFSNSGKELISVGRDKVINVWDMNSSSPKKTIPIFQELGGIITIPRDIIESDSLPQNLKTRIDKIMNKLQDSAQAEKVNRDGLTVIVGGEEVLRAWCIETSECIWNDQGIEFKKKTDKTQDKEPLYTINSILLGDDKFISITSEHNMMIYDLNNFERAGEIIGYNDEITDIKYVGGEMDYKKIVVATNSNDIRFYDLDTLKAEILRGHQDLVMSIDVSYDGKLLLSGSKDCNVLLWDLVNKSVLHTFTGHTGTVTAVALPNKSSMFAISASDDKTIKLWKLSNSSQHKKSQSVLTKIAHEKDINTVVIAPNDKIFATGSQDNYIKIWGVNDFNLLGSIKAHKRGVWSCAFSPVDQVIMSCSSDGLIKIWSLQDFSCLRTFEGHKGSILKCAFISYGMQLISCGSEGLIKLWNVKTSECVNTFEAHQSKIWALAVNQQDQDLFISGGSDSRIVVWRDHTQIQEDRERQEEDNKILSQQTLDSCLRQKDYTNALKLALVLNQPRQTLNIFQEMYNETANDKLIRERIPKLQSNEILKCLRYIRDWNTSSKYTQISQTVLNIILTTHKPQDLIRLSSYEVPQLLQTIIPYTERHFQRIDKMLQKTYLIDYAISSINPAASTILIDNNDQENQENDFDEKKKPTTTTTKEEIK
ncbi:WD40 repeat-containing protein [Tieghemostelium lacteum]|uniref:WD40 repeat-containing protein n=1 Tax=Tieghemostelium lacteum TaxID=361077 RepID=A0A152A4H4_TIELA|nr:WD40 repeat-containing protein [Tieghemostelium lacteum]|eukprot:KYR00961.1 WD40 repeat-containing protein [Tieghemostelium lacteum]